MPGLDEAQNAKPPLGAGLAEGVESISASQRIKFTKYLKLILPLDGFVFWVRSDLVGPSALLNASRFNATLYNEAPRPLRGPATFEAAGSLHYATDQYQTEEESFALNRVVFTSEGPVEDLNDISPMVAYIGEIDDIRFAFSQRGAFYRQADLYHYRGDAIYPSMESQIIDDPTLLDTRNLVVSNSLPIWLTLNRIMPLYPSFLAPDNLRPPYGVVHVIPEGTRTLQVAPFIDAQSNHWQLAADRVRVTMYGLRNFGALDFVDYVNQYTLDTDIMGIMNMPVIRDEKRAQNELNILAQKKTIEYEVSYNQARLREVARQLILSCIPTYVVSDIPLGAA